LRVTRPPPPPPRTDTPCVECTIAIARGRKKAAVRDRCVWRECCNECTPPAHGEDAGTLCTLWECSTWAAPQHPQG
jgi:hypothetical protein